MCHHVYSVLKWPYISSDIVELYKLQKKLALISPVPTLNRRLRTKAEKAEKGLSPCVLLSVIIQIKPSPFAFGLYPLNDAVCMTSL